MRVDFIVKGEAVGKARPRVCGGHAFTPEKTKLYEAQVGWEYARAAKNQRAVGFLTPPLSVTITAYHEPPRSWSKKKRAEAAGRAWCGLPDADNICKSILDGLQGVAFQNDSEVAEVVVRKRYAGEGEAARAEITVEEAI